MPYTVAVAIPGPVDGVPRLCSRVKCCDWIHSALKMSNECREYVSQYDAGFNHVQLNLRLTLVGPASTSSNLIADHERAIGDDDNLHIVHDNSVSVKQSLEGAPKSEIEEEQSQWFTKSCSGAASVRFCHLPLPPFLPVGIQLTRSSNRPCSSRMATRPRNATFLQQGVTLGLPFVRRRGGKLRVLVTGCRPETTEDFGGEETIFVGKESEEGREGGG